VFLFRITDNLFLSNTKNLAGTEDNIKFMQTGYGRSSHPGGDPKIKLMNQIICPAY